MDNSDSLMKDGWSMQLLDNLAYDNTIDDTAILYMPEFVEQPEKKRRGYALLKRFVDIMLSALAIVILSPLFLLTAMAVKVDSPGSAIFAHHRIGINGKKIRIYKFRSMVTNAEELCNYFTPEQKMQYEKEYKLDHDCRITRVGKFIRKTSLDELPQLINILAGDLSIVGPRPVVKDEIDKYGRERDALLSVKPGLTGYWQVNGRNNVTYEMRMQMELYYVRNCTFWMDIKIMIKTVPAVLLGRGAK